LIENELERIQLKIFIDNIDKIDVIKKHEHIVKSYLNKVQAVIILEEDLRKM